MNQSNSVLSVECLTQEIATLSAERDAYQQELFETERHSAWLSTERQTLLERCRELEDKCRQTEAQFLRSTSWRVTKPLRWLSRLRRIV